VHDWIEHLKFDAVISYCSGMYPYTLPAQDVEIPVLVDLVDVDSQKWFDYAARAGWPARWLYRTEGYRVRRLEQEICERCEAVTVVSAAEAKLLREFGRKVAVHSVPNGVDLEFFQPQFNGDDKTSEVVAAPPNQECVFVGALDYRANVEGVTWFCRDVWPQVHARFPKARFVLVGRNPVSQVRRLAALPGVDFIGEVPDVRPYLHHACLAVVPLRIARGIQNKVLEAMAAAKPVIASPQSLEGLDVVPGEHVYRAADAAEWVAGISSLFGNVRERDRLAAAGRAFVCEHHQWESCMRPLETLLGKSKAVTARRLSAALG
jgi:sugar transferase (PEP-CTERM/EpsH1 system associated)